MGVLTENGLQRELLLLIDDDEYKKLRSVKAEQVKTLKEEEMLGVFVRDDSSGNLSSSFLKLQEYENVPWKYRIEFSPGKELFDLTVSLTAGKPDLEGRLGELSLTADFPVRYWNFAKNLIGVFFFVESNGVKDVRPQVLMLKLPLILAEYGDRKIEEQGLDLFYDRVLKVGNPYSPEYAYGVWTTFVKNRYEKPKEKGG